MIEAWVEHASGHDEWYLSVRGSIPEGWVARTIPGKWATPEKAVASDAVDALLAEWGYARHGDALRDEVGRWWIPTRPM
jgi:hypothetical protein